jgi:hypothetical protein
VSAHRHYATPTQCPTCHSRLRVSGLRCDTCDTEVRGRFSTCEFCSLDDDQRRLLRVFLASRGNAKELERHLGVSYPTARARLDDLLAALDITPSAAPPPAPPKAENRRQVIAALAQGDLDVDAALARLERNPD